LQNQLYLKIKEQIETKKDFESQLIKLAEIKMSNAKLQEQNEDLMFIKEDLQLEKQNSVKQLSKLKLEIVKLRNTAEKAQKK
jgi:hypothetical protein